MKKSKIKYELIESADTQLLGINEIISQPENLYPGHCCACVVDDE